MKFSKNQGIMLIDINANVGHWPFQKVSYNSCKELLSRMDQYGIDQSVVSNMNGIFYKNSQASNEELYNEITSDKRFRNRLIPFAIINPKYAEWESDLEICANEMGMKGIRLYPKYHGYDLTDASCIKLIEKAKERELVIAFTSRMFDPRGPRHWMDVETQWSINDILPVLLKVPDARYFFLNSGRITLKDEDVQSFKNLHLLIDTSGRISNLYELISKYGNEKFAFGTHSPILDPYTSLLRIESLSAAEADLETKQLLKSGNAQKFLNI